MILKSKLNHIIEINENNVKKNKQIQEEIIYWENKKEELNKEYIDLKSSVSSLDTEIKIKSETAQNIINSKIELMKEQMDRKAEDLANEYQLAIDDANSQYLEILMDLSQESINTTNSIIKLEKKLNELKSKHDAAVDEYKRAQEMNDKKDFYRLQLTDIDLEEIRKLKEVEPYLRDTRPLNKVIWSVYYENPYTDLIGRIIGRKKRTGIYKLTNLSNNMIYIGQAVNIGDRWKQHIKCAIGADSAPNNKLYPAMRAVGPENFTFEIIEECLPEELNEREQYWQDFYKAKEFGYSVR